jgi:hypothetical protein
MRWIFVGLFLSALPAFATSRDAAKEKAVLMCVEKAKATPPEEWKKGPCISDGQNGLADWVVDVAHAPRQAVDDQPSNQCSAFVENRITKFVEVDTGCNVIRASK